MEGITLVETKVFEALISEVKDMRNTMVSILSDMSDNKKPYLTSQEVMEITGFSRAWLNNNKQDIGFSMAGGELRFKRKDVEAYMEQNYFKTKASRRAYK